MPQECSDKVEICCGCLIPLSPSARGGVKKENRQLGMGKTMKTPHRGDSEMIPVEPETCSDTNCQHPASWHLIGIGCSGIKGWEPSDVQPVSESTPFVGQGLLDFFSPPKAVRLSPIWCSCLNGEMAPRNK
jgi:hypothetical protein